MPKKTLTSTPSAAGYYMPAEWEHHAATLIGWPHRENDWPGKFDAIRWAYGEIVRGITPGEKVRILVNDNEHQASATIILEDVGVNLGQIDFLPFPSDRSWARDFGPIIVRNSADKFAVADFAFNAWAKYPEWELDNDIPRQIAEHYAIPRFVITAGGNPFILEGGSIDVNGDGALLTTEECLLDQEVQTRNPGLGQRQVEDALRQSLGISEIIWLGKGIAGDDTHGHVDDLCRFVNRSTVALCQEKDPTDENYQPLNENRERLENIRLADGSGLEVIELPMPRPLWFAGTRLPASYANFYICNSAVLVPTFNDPADRTALGIIAELFNDRPVIGIHAIDLVWGFGTLHCLTQQQPV